jgi:hypothetical protein
MAEPPHSRRQRRIKWRMILSNVFSDPLALYGQRCLYAIRHARSIRPADDVGRFRRKIQTLKPIQR